MAAQGPEGLGTVLFANRRLDTGGDHRVEVYAGGEGGHARGADDEFPAQAVSTAQDHVRFSRCEGQRGGDATPRRSAARPEREPGVQSESRAAGCGGLAIQACLMRRFRFVGWACKLPMYVVRRSSGWS